MSGQPVAGPPGAVSDRAILMMVSKAVSHACFLLIAVVLARALSRTDFGTFNQVWLVHKSLFYLFSLGLPVSVYYFLPRLAESGRKGFILQTMASLTVLAVPLALTSFLLAEPLARYFNNPGLAPQMRLFAIWPLVTLPTVSTDAVLLSLGQAGRAAAFEVASKLGMILAVALAALGGGGLHGILVALLLAGILQSLLGIWLIWSPIRSLPLTIDGAALRAQLAYAVPYGLGALVAAVNWQVDKIVVSLLYPPDQFAIYAAGALEIPLAGVTSVVVVSVIMPEFTRRFHAGETAGFLDLWHHSIRKLALPIFAVTGFLMVFAGPVVRLAFSAQYADSVWPFRIYLLFLPLRVTVLSQVLAATGETRPVLTAQARAMVVNVVLGYTLTRNLGWLGGAVAALAADYLFSWMLLRRLAGRLGAPARRLIPWRELGQLTLLAGVSAIACLPILRLVASPVWQLAAGFTCFAAVYVVAASRADFITRSDWLTLRRWVGVGLATPLRKAP